MISEKQIQKTNLIFRNKEAAAIQKRYDWNKSKYKLMPRDEFQDYLQKKYGSVGAQK